MWTACLSDPSLSDLSLEDFGRWAKLLAYTTEHGDGGVLRVYEPMQMMRLHFGMDTSDDVIDAIRRLPNICVEKEGNAWVITWQRWHKYQVDDSASRVARARAAKKDTATDRKGKSKHLDHVWLTDNEYMKLADAMGVAGRQRILTDLNHYIGAHGDRYKSHYSAAMNFWKRDKEKHGTDNSLSNTELAI